VARSKERIVTAKRARAYLLELVRSFEKAVESYAFRGTYAPEEMNEIKDAYWNAKRKLLRTIRRLKLHDKQGEWDTR